jgi:hypothetical protein
MLLLIEVPCRHPRGERAIVEYLGASARKAAW